MIKINLTTTKKQIDISNVGGFDFTKLKFKLVLVIMVLIYVPDIVLVPMWEENQQNLTTELTKKQQQLNKLRNKVTKSQDLEKQIRELKAQEENLEKKLTAVKEAISTKKNPSEILLYIAKNIPADLWIKDLSIDGDKMTIRGEALDPQSVGGFISNLKSSIFIKDANITSTSSNVRESDKKRLETFEVRFSIARFNQ